MDSYSLTTFFGGTAATPPSIVSSVTLDATHIRVVFSENMNVTIGGWSASNGSPLSPSSVSGSGTTWSFVVSTMAYGETITISYDSVTGNTTSAVTGLELPTTTNFSVTNTLAPPSAVLIQYKVDTVGGSGILAFDSSVTAGSLIVVQYAGTIDLDSATGSDNIVGAYNFAVKSRNGYAKSTNMFYYYNHPGGSTTVTCTGINSSQVTAIFEYGSIYTAADPLMDAGGALGSTTPLVDSLTFANNSLLVCHWYNEGTDDYTGMVGVNTVIQHSVANFNLQAQKLSEAATTLNVGVTTGGNADNVMTCAAFRIA